MAFSFECPHCEMGFEAEFELCGSTCTCPGCGGLFVVPEVDPTALQQAQDAAQMPAGEPSQPGPGAEVFVELARLQKELAAGAQQRQALEQQLALEKSRAQNEGALAAELKEAKSAQKKAETLAKALGEQLQTLQEQLGASDAKFQKLEESARTQTQALERAGELLRRELSAATEASERAKQALDQPAREVAKLRADLDAAAAKSERLNAEIERERSAATAQLAEMRKELESAVAQRKGAEAQSAGRSGELERLQAALEAERTSGAATLEKLALAQKAAEAAQQALETETLRTKTSVEEASRLHATELSRVREMLAQVEGKLESLEKEKEVARTTAKMEADTLQKQLTERKLELERVGLTVAEATKETERLRAELAGVKAEKWSAERGFAEEHERLLGRLRSVETERDTLREEYRLQARAATQPDGELVRLRGELSEALAAGSSAKRQLEEERSQAAGRLELLEQARDAAGERSEKLLKEIAALRAQLELAQNNLESQKAFHEPKTAPAPPPGLSAEAEAELRQILARRDLEIQRLAAQIRNANQNAGTHYSPNSPLGWLTNRPALALALVASLAIGLLGGAALSRPKSVPEEVSKETAHEKTAPQKADPSNSTASSPNSLLSSVVPATPASSVASSTATAPASPVPPAPAPVATTVGSLTASRAGMPTHLPDQFLGIRFGTELSEVAGLAQWKETAGKRHRKAELLGSEVEAVLTADAQNRLIMGSYVRVASRQPDALTPFLEWAVNVQDAVSALYGEPIRVHSVEGATDAGEVVRKIAAGEDFYQATWEREAEDGMIDLSIRVFNERSVVFRMEYRARQLYQGFVEAQATKDGVTKDGAKDAAPPAPTKVE